MSQDGKMSLNGAAMDILSASMLFLADYCRHQPPPRNPLSWPEIVKTTYLSVDNPINSASENLKSTIDVYNTAAMPRLASAEISQILPGIFP